MKPILSICVPTYSNENREGRINEQLNEFIIIKKKFKEEIEIIIVDDSNKEKDLSFLDDLKKHNILYYKNEKRRGLINNFAHCLEICNGIYVMPISDEDRINIVFLENIFCILREGVYNAIFGTVKTIESGNVWYYWGNKRRKRIEDVLTHRIAFYGHFSGYILKTCNLDIKDIVNTYNSCNQKHYFPVTAAILMCAKEGQFITFKETICYCGVFAGKEYDINSLEGVPYNHPQARVATIKFIKSFFIDSILNEDQRKLAVKGLFKQFTFLFKNDAKHFSFPIGSAINYIKDVKKIDEINLISNRYIFLTLMLYKLFHYIKNKSKNIVKRIIGRI